MRYCILLIVVFIFGGCSQNNQQSNVVKKDNIRRVHINAPSISVVQTKVKILDDNRVVAQITGYNNGSYYRLLEYRIQWFDADGFLISNSAQGWRDVPAFAKAEFFIKSPSPTGKGVDFKIIIRLKNSVEKTKRR